MNVPLNWSQKKNILNKAHARNEFNALTSKVKRINELEKMGVYNNTPYKNKLNRTRLSNLMSKRNAKLEHQMALNYKKTLATNPNVHPASIQNGIPPPPSITSEDAKIAAAEGANNIPPPPPQLLQNVNTKMNKVEENAQKKAAENALAAKAKEPIGYEIPPLKSVLPESKILVNTNTFQNTRTDCDEKNPGRLASVHFHLGTRKWVIKHPSQKLKGKFFSKYYSGNTAEEAAQKYIKCNPDPYKNLNTEYMNIEKVTTNKSTAASKLETAKKRMGYLQRTIKTGTSVTQNGKVKTKEDFQKELDELRKYGIPQLERNYKAARTVKRTTVKTSSGREKELQKRCYKVPMFGSFKPGVTKKSDNKNRSNCKQYYERLGDNR